MYIIFFFFRETDEIGTQGQRDSGRRIGERITDTTFWRNEVRFFITKSLLIYSLIMFMIVGFNRNGASGSDVRETK